ncbi:MAG: prolipoprotein diacylglyceryl transferase family protein [Gemmatimonadota bacterium]
MIPFVEQPALHLGPLTIQAFGVIVASAALAGDAIYRRRLAARGLDMGIGSRLAGAALIGGFLFAHLFSVVLYFPERLRSDPWLLLRVWEDVSSFGGMIGGALGVGVFLYRARADVGREDRWSFIEAAAFALPFAWAVGRVACTLAHDHPGTITTFPLAISLRTTEAQEYIRGVYTAAGRLSQVPASGELVRLGFHDLGWYEFLYLAVIVCPVFLALDRRPRTVGTYLSAFALLYAPMRIALDTLRVSDARYAGLTPGQYAAVLMLLVPVTIWARRRRVDRVSREFTPALILPLDEESADLTADLTPSSQHKPHANATNGMTLTHERLGDVLDVVPDAPGEFYARRVRHALERAAAEADASGDAEFGALLEREQSLLDICQMDGSGESVFREPHKAERAAHALKPDAGAYFALRAQETGDPLLRVLYLEYVLSAGPTSGREWLTNVRAAVDAHRELLEHARRVQVADPSQTGHLADHVSNRLTVLLRRGGVLQGSAEIRPWAEWVTGFAESMASFAWEEPKRAWLAARWSFRPLRMLTALRESEIAPDVRRRALDVVGHAYATMSADVGSDLIAANVAQVEADLLNHFKVAGATEAFVRRRYELLAARAEAESGKGAHVVAAHFYRQARKVMEERRDLFPRQEVAAVQRKEQEHLRLVESTGALSEVTVPLPFDPEMLDQTQATPADTIQLLLREAEARLPDPDKLAVQTKTDAEVAPLASMMPQSLLGSGKVVGEATTDDQLLAAGIEWRMTIHASILGTRYDVTLAKAAKTIGLGPDDVMQALAALQTDDGTKLLLRAGIERYLAEDHISAVHILVPRVEDLLRQQLNAWGVETTTFQAPSGTETTRTDDATFGGLLRRTAADGTTVEALLGTRLFRYVEAIYQSPSGLNLRNTVAHGLARPGTCVGTTSGIVLHTLFALASRAQARLLTTPAHPSPNARATAAVAPASESAPPTEE